MKIYNFLKKRKENLLLLKENAFTFYVCGITPYESPHLGHLVASIRFNFIRQYLKFIGKSGVFVQNITDIDDKIIQKAAELGSTPQDVAQTYTLEYERLLVEFDIEKPDVQPKVTEYINEIIKYIQDLITDGYAYATEEGNVYFDVYKKKDYGKLSHRTLSEQLQNSRKIMSNDKKNPEDFTLWKSETIKGAYWPSPWGNGRPGWHIECSVMSNCILGNTIDFHGGGLDLLFPHHENELAQSEAHNNGPFVNYWIYSGLLQVNGVKMSKSLGNFITIKEGLEKYGTELILFAVMKHHYRSSIDFCNNLFRSNMNSLLRFHRLFKYAQKSRTNTKEHDIINEASSGGVSANEIENAFKNAMDDDFNTPKAIVILEKAAIKFENQIHSGNVNGSSIISGINKIKYLGNILGLFKKDSDEVMQQLLRFHSHMVGIHKPLTLLDVHNKIKKVIEARNQKDYGNSDKLREELLRLGLQLSQNPSGDTDWQFDLTSL